MQPIRFSIDQTPRLNLLPFFGLQHVLTMLGATVAVPTILAAAYGLDGQQTALLISNVLVAMGIATIIQTMFGTRLPIVQGSSFAFLPALLYVASVHSGPDGLAYASGAIIIGAILQAFLGFSKVAGLLQRVLTPVVIGPTIMVIGLSLFSVGGSQASTNWVVSGATIALIMLFSFGVKGVEIAGARRWLSTFPVVLAIGSVWLVCVILSISEVLSSTDAAYVDLTGVTKSSVFKTQGYLLPWGIPKFDVAFLLIFVIAYLVSTVESVGDYNAINEISQTDQVELSPETVNRGVLAEGLGCLVAGLFGANPTTSYSENIGVVGITGVASRMVVVAGAGILIVAGLLPVIGALLATIPAPIMGGLYCVLFGMIAGVGLRYAAKANLHSMRNISIMGFALFFGFAIPSAFATPELKEATINLFGPGFADVVLGIVTSNMAITAISGLIWDNLLGKE